MGGSLVHPFGLLALGRRVCLLQRLMAVYLNFVGNDTLMLSNPCC